MPDKPPSDVPAFGGSEADAQVPASGDGADAPEGPKKPLAIRQAKWEIEQAQKELKDKQKALQKYLDNPNAKDTDAAAINFQKDIDDAKKALKEKEKALEELTSPGSQEARQKARELYMKDYYNQLGGQWIAALVKEDPELRRLFETAIRNNWDEKSFLYGADGKGGLYETAWWKAHDGSVSWQQAFQMEHAADQTRWNQSLHDARQAIADFADKTYGLKFDKDTLDALSKRYLYEGWDRNDNRGLRVWLAGKTNRQGTDPAGEWATNVQSLRDAANELGVDYTDQWFENHAKKAMNPNSGVLSDEVIQQMVDDAKSLYPVWADKIGYANGKVTGLRSVAGAYIARVQSMLELDPSAVQLKDPLFKRAFNSLQDDKGNPKLMSLYDFEKAVREDPRWQKTSNARDTYLGATQGLLKAMGFVG